MMPTLSSRSAPIPPRDPSRPTSQRPANRRPATPTQAPAIRSAARHHKGTFAVAIIIIGLTTAGCGHFIGSSTDPSADAAGQVSQQECVSAVYTVLTGMVAKPDDDQPFEDFVNRYGADSPTYTAYRDSFDPFYTDAVTHGIKSAEQDVRTLVTRDCATTN
jgi:hypothetical protein